jgi:hypothetical protein
MGVEKIGIVRKIVRRIFSIEPFDMLLRERVFNRFDTFFCHANGGEDMLVLRDFGNCRYSVIIIPEFRFKIQNRLWIIIVKILLWAKIL